MVRRFGNGGSLPGAPLGRAGARPTPWRKLVVGLGLVLVVFQLYSWNSLPAHDAAADLRRDVRTPVAFPKAQKLAALSGIHQGGALAPGKAPSYVAESQADSTILSDEESLFGNLASEPKPVSNKPLPKPATGVVAKPRPTSTAGGQQVAKAVGAVSPGTSADTAAAGGDVVAPETKRIKEPTAAVTVRKQKEVQPVVQFANVDKAEKIRLSTPQPTKKAPSWPLPAGAYEDSCAGCVRSKADFMSCTCCLIDGKNCAWNANLTMTKHCPAVDNNKGVLQCQKGLPPGSYSKSCKECVERSNHLSCGCCIGPEGTCLPTSPLLVTSDCGDVDNRRGQLVCANTTLPEGLYEKSCQNCTFDGASSSLRCGCCNVYDRTKLLERGHKAVLHCAKTEPVKIVEGCNEVFNNQGQLQCRGSLPPGGYLEDCTDCTSSRIERHVPLEPVAGIPVQYRDTNPVSKLTCGCCSYGPSKPGCRPSVSLLIQKQWCKNVKTQNGFLRCSEKVEGAPEAWPGSYSDSCIKCNATQISDPATDPPQMFTKLTCVCLDASNTYQPPSSIVLKKGCELVGNVRGKLTCHPASSQWHQAYQFLRTADADTVNPRLNDVVRQLNLGEDAAKETQEGEEAWQAFLTHAREMPKKLFAGKHSNTKGIVILGGGTTYFISAWVDILMIRIQNCTLPIELWVDNVPEEQLPPAVVEELTSTLGVTVRTLDMLPQQDATAGFTHSKKFVLKPAAIVFSRFQHVIFLDADNIPVINLNRLFELPEYIKTGSIFWPDFPALKAAAEVWKELPVSPFMGPQAESGQMVIDKARHWEPLMLALYFNVHADWYYPKISFGDKDTYQTAWYVLQHDFTMIHWPVASVGYGAGCSYNKESDQTPELFRGHTMLQRGPSGEPMFLHKNLRKWSTANMESLPKSLPEPSSADSWKGRTWQTVATCELNEGLSIDNWFQRTNTISSQLCNNLWFFERTSQTVDLDVSLLMRFQCAPTVKSVRVKEHSFVDYIGFDVEKTLLSAYRAVFDNVGYQQFVAQTPTVKGYHTSFCHGCKLEQTLCPECTVEDKMWSYTCECKSPLGSQVSEKLTLYEADVPKFCQHGMIRYLNHTLVCQHIPVSEVWSGHFNYL